HAEQVAGLDLAPVLGARRSRDPQHEQPDRPPEAEERRALRSAHWIDSSQRKPSSTLSNRRATTPSRAYSSLIFRICIWPMTLAGMTTAQCLKPTRRARWIQMVWLHSTSSGRTTLFSRSSESHLVALYFSRQSAPALKSWRKAPGLMNRCIL